MISRIDDEALGRILELARRLGAARTPEQAAALIEQELTELVGADHADCVYVDGRTGELWHPTRASGAMTHANLSEPHAVQVGVVDQDGERHAMLRVERSREAFDARSKVLVERVAAEVAPMLRRLALEVRLAHRTAVDDGDANFRPEVLAARRDRTFDGRVVRVSPRWIDWAYPPLGVFLAVAMLYLTVGTVSRYSTGQALVELHGRSELTAPFAGTIAALSLEPGARVAAGAPVAWLCDVDGQQDGAAIVAPRAGRVASVRIRVGQWVEAGSLVATLAGGDEGSIVAILPGRDRPLLAAGMRARFELDGPGRAGTELVVDEVGEEILSPAEARRYLGPERSNGLYLEQPVVILRLHLPTPTFRVDGKTYRYHHGMRGAVEVRVDEETLFEVLFRPGRGSRS